MEILSIPFVMKDVYIRSLKVVSRLEDVYIRPLKFDSHLEERIYIPIQYIQFITAFITAFRMASLNSNYRVPYIASGFFKRIVAKGLLLIT